MDIPELIQFKQEGDDTKLYVMGKEVLGWIFGLTILGLILSMPAIAAFREGGWMYVAYCVLGYCCVGVIWFRLFQYFMSRGKRQ